MNNKWYYTADEVAEYMGISKSRAYRIIKELNNELAKSGYIVIPGKVPRKYLQEKIYGILLAV